METMRETLVRLKGAQKGRARGAPAYSVYVNRPVGRVLAALAYRAGMTPNQVTIVSAIFTFTGIAVIATVPQAWWVGVLVWLLLALGYAWDSADGQVARLRGGGSLAGEWLDHFVDAAKISTLHLAVLVGLSRVADVPTLWLAAPIVFTAVANTTFFGMLLNDLLKGKRGIPSSAATGGASPLRSLLVLPTDFGVLCVIFVAWGFPAMFVAAYSVLLVCCGAFLAAAAVKWFLDMKRIDREASPV